MSISASPSISPAIRGLLGRLRQRIRAYVWVEGIASLLCVLGAAFWLGLAIDWLFEPSTEWRFAGLGIATVCAVWVLHRTLIARVFAPLSDTSMAVLLERHGGEFHDSLLTSVELAGHDDPAARYSPQMLQHTAAQAQHLLPGVRLGDVFNLRPVLWKLAIAVLLVGSVLLFGFSRAEAFGFYIQRLGMSQELWPRRARLVVEGFEPGDNGLRVVKAPRGGSLDLTIRADNRPPFAVPDQVEIRYWLEDGGRGRGETRKIGQALSGVDDFQEFNFTFENLHQSLTFDVVGFTSGLFGEDDRLHGLRIEVVESPAIDQMVLICDYPAYMQRGEQQFDITSSMRMPYGSVTTLAAQTNKPLAQVRIFSNAESEPEVLELTGSPKERRSFLYELAPLVSDRVLYFELLDDDGIRTPPRDRDRISISAIADEAPQVTVSLDGIGQYLTAGERIPITAQARIPVVGSVADDYGIDRIWFEHQRGDAEPGSAPVPADISQDLEVKIDHALDLEPLEFQPQQTLSMSLRAADHYDLGDRPNEGVSRRFNFEIVTPAELRVLLEREELRLRLRFENVYAEMDKARGLIGEIRFADGTPDASEGKVAPQDSAGPAEAPDGSAVEDGGADATAAAGADSNSATAGAEQDAAEEELARRRLQIVKALHYVERNGHDVLSIAGGIEEIRAVLVNNRMDEAEWKERLRGDLAEPLGVIGGEMMQKLATRLAQLESAADQPQAGQPLQQEALAQADAILEAMQAVLDRMLELGSYNEVLDDFRSLIQDLQRLEEKTDEQRKKALLRGALTD